MTTIIRCLYMQKQYNVSNLEAEFKQYLVSVNSSPISIKNYLSDIRHFIGWVRLNRNLSKENIVDPSSFFTAMNGEIMASYIAYLNDPGIPIASINRKLSCLRKFFTFAISQGWTEENIPKKIRNIKIKSQLTLDNLTKEYLNQVETVEEKEDIMEFLKIAQR